MQTLLCDQVIKTPDSFVIAEWKRIFIGISRQHEVMNHILVHLQHPSIESANVACSYWAQFLSELEKTSPAVTSQKKLFENACASAEVTPFKVTAVTQLFHETFSTLSKHERLGFLLAYEVMVSELVDMVLQLMSHNQECFNRLNETAYFKLQSSWMPTSTKKAISEFIVKCKTTSEINSCLDGYKKAMKFWQRFWSGCSQEINSRHY